MMMIILELRSIGLGLVLRISLQFVKDVSHTIRSLIIRVLQKMIMYGFCQRTNGYDKIDRNELWLLSMFEDRNHERTLDATTLKELIRPDGRMCRMEVRQGVLKRMARKQSYHSDRYAGVFEHIVRHYGVKFNGEYAPPGYDEQQ
ncbi:hypothetical protein Tco_0748613 [Tanacetum coccineum]|uniref:LAGLIDADG homing endonuclease n=1 Tax=Tanacetum coccineum TaxID=301880 RepID=A0ABQ4YYU6_9ASTR